MVDQLLPPPAPEAVIISELLALLFPALCGVFLLVYCVNGLRPVKAKLKTSCAF